MKDSEKTAYEYIKGHESVLRIPLANIQNSDFVLEALRDTFEACLENGICKFVVDLKNITMPPPTFIALLVEISSRARRLGGDVKFINLSPQAKSHIGTFSPRNYLSMDDNESDALESFSLMTNAPECEPKAPPIERKRERTDPTLASDIRKSKQTMEKEDIAEDPIIAKLESQVGRSIAKLRDIQGPGLESDSRTSQKLKSDPTTRPEIGAPEPAPQRMASRAGKKNSQVEDLRRTETNRAVGRTPETGPVTPVKGERNHLRVKSLAKNLYAICDFVIKYATRASFDSKVVGKMRIAVYEACLNVIEHAYHSNPENWIDVWIEYNAEMFKVVIQDYGTGFDGFSDQKFDAVSAMDGRQTGGFGLYIILRSMDKVDYRPDQKHGNRLTMVKFIKDAANEEKDVT